MARNEEKINTMKQRALEYREKYGCSVIPTKANKKPYLNTWASFQETPPTPKQLDEWWDKWPKANIGLVTGKVSGRDVIDVDSDAGVKELKKLLPKGYVTQMLKTPRGGYHLHFKHTPGLTNAVRFLEGCDLRTQGGYAIVPPSRGSNGKGYEWVTGRSLVDVPLAAPPAALLSLLKNLSIRGIRGGQTRNLTLNHGEPQLTTHNHGRIPLGSRDEVLFHIANAIISGKMPIKELEWLLTVIGLHCCDPPFSLDEIPIKIQSALDRAETQEKRVGDMVREWVLTTEGHFLTTDYHAELRLTTHNHKKAAMMTLLRMEKEGLIEKYGAKRGCYRMVNREVEQMDFLHAPMTSVDLWLPFGLRDMVEILPGNLIVIAGTANSGKTAALLNVIKENMDLFDCHYFNSESGDTELRKRLGNFGIPLKDWHFKAYERGDNFSDVIVGGEGRLNVIDYLEMHDDFFKVGGYLNQIHKKLNGAVAIIALQKNPGVKVGLGGFRSLEKPRLYLSMSPGKLRIVKAKIWRTTENPNGKEIRFKLVNGCKFIKEGDWYLPDED